MDDGTPPGNDGPEQDPKDRWDSALKLKENFGAVSDGERIERLRSFISDEEADIRGIAAEIVANHFGEVPAELSGEMVSAFSVEEDPLLRTRAAHLLFSHFDTLGPHCTDCVDDFIGDPIVSVRRAAGKEINENFDLLPPALRQAVIVSMAADEDSWVRRGAAKTIVNHFAKLPDDVRGVLDRLLEDPEDWVREGILEQTAAIFSHADPRLKEAFGEAVARGSPQLRRQALSSLLDNLDNFAGQEKVEMFGLFLSDPDKNIRKEAAGSLRGRLGDMKVKYRMALLDTLADSADPTLRHNAGGAVLDMYSGLDSATRTFLLLRLINDGDQSVRYGVLEGLERNIEAMGPDGAGSLLEQFIPDEDVWIRNLAAKVILANYNYLGDRALGQLARLALDEDIRVSRTVLQGVSRHLEELPAEVKMGILERFMGFSDPWVVRTLAEVAANDWEGADEQLRSHLAGALSNPDQSVRTGAATAILDNLADLPREVVEGTYALADPSSPEPLRRAFMDVFGERFSMLPDWYRGKILGMFVQDPSPWVRARAIDAVNESFSTEFVGLAKHIVQMMWDDESPEVKESILYLMLEHLPEMDNTGQKALTMFAEGDEHPIIKVRTAAVIMRHRSIIDTEVMGFLSRLARFPDPSVRLELLEAFMEEGYNLLPAESNGLLKIFEEDEDEDIRNGVTGLLDE